jgi:hypothetical protein
MAKVSKVREYGRTWDARVPRGDISWLMGRVHVATPDSEIEADLRRRCAGAGSTIPADLVDECVQYALAVHKANRDLFAHFRLGGGIR